MKVVAITSLPVTLPSTLTTTVPVVIGKSPDAVPDAMVVPKTNLSLDSSQPIKALSPVDPLFMSIPLSFILESTPRFNSMSVSFTLILTVSTDVVLPLTSKFPVIVTSPDALISLTDIFPAVI